MGKLVPDQDLMRRRAELWRKQGWFPVRWAHHPERFKQVYRSKRWRPIGKHCFRNAQRLVVDVNKTTSGPEVMYQEGVVMACGLPVPHAWVVVDGKPFDVTLEHDAELHPTLTLSFEETLVQVVTTRQHGVVDLKAIAAKQQELLGLTAEAMLRLPSVVGGQHP